jgi:glycine oxidase
MKINSKNIGIVGAGIMGRLLAWQLVNQGHEVTLFDKDAIESGSAAAYTAAGMLTPFSEIESAEMMIYQMGKESLKLWPDIIKGFGCDVGFHQKGSLIVSHINDKADLVRFNQQLNFKLKSQLLENVDQQTGCINQVQLSQLEPELAANFSSATYLPEEAWLCTHCVMKTLADLLLEKRVRWFAHTEIDELGPHFINEKPTRSKTQIKHEFDWVIDSRGLGAKKDLPELRGVRGELLLLQAPEVKINRMIRLMHPRYRLYVVPKYKDDLYLIGATQIESDDSGPITVRSTLELLSAAYSLHPGFSEARVIESKTNCRPALKDNLPRIETKPGLIRINGLFRHGFLLAPSLANQVIQLISQVDCPSANYITLIKQVAVKPEVKSEVKPEVKSEVKSEIKTEKLEKVIDRN